MNRRETSDEIDAAAADWVVRLERAPVDPAISQAFEAWLAGGDRRRGAFFRAQAAWRLLDRAQAIPYAATPLAQRRPADVGRRYVLGGAVAASLAAIGFTARMVWGSLPQTLQTRLGEQRTVAMSDGSTVALDTATQMQVRLRENVRLVELEKGEAWFHVAKDRNRPFIIDAGALTARAVGTAFTVGRHEDGVTRVIVTEGVVEVACGAAGAARLTPGMQAVIGPDGRLRVETLSEAAMSRELAWREQKIALDGRTVREAAAAFNRYNDVKIVLEDEGLADQKVVGWFSTTDPQGFAEALEIPFGVKATRVGATLRLARADGSPPATGGREAGGRPSQ